MAKEASKEKSTYDSGLPGREKSVFPEARNVLGHAERGLLAFVPKDKPELVPIGREGKNLERTVGDLLKEALGVHGLSQRISFFTNKLQGIKYASDTLSDPRKTRSRDKDASGQFKEKFVVDFAGLDCVTFVETVLAFAYSSSYKSFLANLRSLRYKGSDISYASRNHYMAADWVTNNQALGAVTDVTTSLGGDFRVVNKDLNVIDRDLDGKNDTLKATLAYIPTENFGQVERNIQDGDIISFAAGEIGKDKNVDVEHVGIAILKPDGVHLVDAKYGKVVRDEGLLKNYLTRMKHAGIMVARPKSFSPSAKA